MKRADGGGSCFSIRHAECTQATSHFACRFARERDGQHVPTHCGSGEDAMCDPMGEHAGLSRARPCVHDGGRGWAEHCLALPVVESREK